MCEHGREAPLKVIRASFEHRYGRRLTARECEVLRHVRDEMAVGLCEARHHEGNRPSHFFLPCPHFAACVPAPSAEWHQHTCVCSSRVEWLLACGKQLVVPGMPVLHGVPFIGLPSW
eukprot:11146087-Alexandrium_andersonii.AAC.1